MSYGIFYKGKTQMFYPLLPKISNDHYSTPRCCATSQTVGLIYKPTAESTPTETDGLQDGIIGKPAVMLALFFKTQFLLLSPVRAKYFVFTA